MKFFSMTTQILKLDGYSVQLATKMLLAGEVVGIPTETVYGLGAVGTLPNAVKKILPYPVFKIFRFANVYNLPVLIEHNVNAGIFG